MKIQSAWLVIVCLMAAGTARANTVAETLTGTITGASTVDTNGYFSPAGTNLKGKPVTIAVKYYTPVFNKTYKCLHFDCVDHLATNPKNLSQSVLIKITVDGVTQTFQPSYLGQVYISPGGNVRVQSDAGSFPDTGIFVSIDVNGTPHFGAKLAPSLKSNQDFFTIVPSGSSEEPLNFTVKRASSK